MYCLKLRFNVTFIRKASGKKKKKIIIINWYNKQDKKQRFISYTSVLWSNKNSCNEILYFYVNIYSVNVFNSTCDSGYLYIWVAK